MRIDRMKPPAKEPHDVLAAAQFGGRVAARQRRARGQDDATIRREIIDRFRDEFNRGDPDATKTRYEPLLRAVLRGVDAALAE